MDYEAHVDGLGKELSVLEAEQEEHTELFEETKALRRRTAARIDALRASIEASKKLKRPIDVAVIGPQGIASSEAVGHPGA